MAGEDTTGWDLDANPVGDVLALADSGLTFLRSFEDPVDDPSGQTGLDDSAVDALAAFEVTATTVVRAAIESAGALDQLGFESLVDSINNLGASAHGECARTVVGLVNELCPYDTLEQLFKQLHGDRCRVERGMTYVVPPFALHALKNFHALTARPENFSDAGPIRIAGEHFHDVRVTLDYTLDADLAPLKRLLEGPAGKVAIVRPNACLSELCPPSLSLDLEKHTFFGVGPVDEEIQGDRIRALIDAAWTAADVILVPELSVTEGLAHQLADEYRPLIDSQDDSPRLLVLGSYHHTDDSGRNRNTTVMLLKGHPDLLYHHKYAPFTYGAFVEDIFPAPPEITVYRLGTWSMAVLVCRDALHENARRALADVGVRLVLVPSMSPEIDSFVTALTGMQLITQGFSVVATNPHMWASPARLVEVVQDGGTLSSEDCAIAQDSPGFVAAPFRDTPHSVATGPAEGGPGVAIIDLVADESEWIRLD